MNWVPRSEASLMLWESLRGIAEKELEFADLDRIE